MPNKIKGAREGKRLGRDPLRPAGVDAHTGLEDESGRKSEEKVMRFVREAREAFRLMRASVE